MYRDEIQDKSAVKSAYDVDFAEDLLRQSHYLPVGEEHIGTSEEPCNCLFYASW